MIESQRRFPKSTLFAHAAQLQQQLENWMGRTALDLDRLERLPDQHGRTRILKERHESLRGAWLNLKEARQRLYDCP